MHFLMKNALKLIRQTLRKLNASEDLINMANRKNVLDPMPPPGSSEIVYTRIILNILNLLKNRSYLRDNFSVFG